MPRAKELKVRLPDRPGALGEITTALAEKKINLRAVNAWVEGDEGVVRIIAEATPAARKVLTKMGLKVDELDVVEVELSDKPGALAEKATALGAAGINITHAFVGTAGARKATVFLGVSDVSAALKALR
jgi:hypothetical protein